MTQSIFPRTLQLGNSICQASVDGLKNKAQLAVRAQGFEVERRPPLAKHQAGGAADQHVHITPDINIRLLVLEAPDGEIGVGAGFAAPVVSSRTPGALIRDPVID